MEKKIKEISFPNTVADIDKTFYREAGGCEFKYITKNGEMASINWIEVSREGKIIAEIKESVCDIYY
jgi:hypothetical protein